jgi:hypothetical protein
MAVGNLGQLDPACFRLFKKFSFSRVLVSVFSLVGKWYPVQVNSYPGRHDANLQFRGFTDTEILFIPFNDEFQSGE